MRSTAALYRHALRAVRTSLSGHSQQLLARARLNLRIMFETELPEAERQRAAASGDWLQAQADAVDTFQALFTVAPQAAHKFFRKPSG